MSDYLRLAQVPGYVQKKYGERPHISAVHRWRQRGIAGVRLQVLSIGGTYKTTRELVDQFFADVAVAKSGAHAVAPEPSKTRRASIDRAERELTEAGI